MTPRVAVEVLREHADTVRWVVLPPVLLCDEVSDVLDEVGVECVEVTGPVSVLQLARFRIPHLLLDLEVRELELGYEQLRPDETHRFCTTVVADLPLSLISLTLTSLDDHICHGLVQSLVLRLGLQLEVLVLDGIKLTEWTGLPLLRSIRCLWIGHSTPAGLAPHAIAAREAALTACERLCSPTHWNADQSAFLATRCPNVPCGRLGCHADFNDDPLFLRFPGTRVLRLK